jgi:hypothetical protein
MKVPSWIGTLTLAALFLGGCATGAPPDEAVESLATTTRFEHSAAFASFVHHEACIYTHVQVYAGRSSARYEAGRPSRSNYADVFMYQVETCSTGEVLVSGWGWAELEGGDFSMTGDLGRARLRKAVDVHDWVSDTTVPVRLDLVWSAVGEFWNWKDRHHEDQGNVKLRFRQDGKGYSADVTGVLEAGALKLAMPSVGSGWMSTQSYASVRIEPRRPIAPTIQSFDAYPYHVYDGGTATLSWWVSGTDPITLTIDGGVGDVTGANYVSVTPTETTTYTLTASNARGSDHAQFTVHVLPPPEDDWGEGNDEPASATPIALDFFASDLNITPGDVDWFTFTIDAAVTVSGALWPSSHGFHPFMALYDETLEQIAGAGWWFQEFLEPGTYHVAISAEPDYGFSGHHAGTGYYTLQLTAPLPPVADVLEPNDARSTAAPLGTYVFTRLTITPGDIDWFTFSLDVDARVEISVGSSEGNLDVRATLFDEVDVARDVGWFMGSLPAGVYHLVVTDEADVHFTGDHTASGFYDLYLRAVALSEPDAFEPNDTPADAEPIALVDASARLTITPHDVDWFTFTLSTPTTVVADVDANDVGSTLDAMLGLFDADLDLLAYNDDHGSLDPRIEVHLPPGTYYLAVTGFPDVGFDGNHLQDGFYFLNFTVAW